MVSKEGPAVPTIIDFAAFFTAPTIENRSGVVNGARPTESTSPHADRGLVFRSARPCEPWCAMRTSTAASSRDHAPTVARPISVVASRTTTSVLPPACTTPGVATASLGAHQHGQQADAEAVRLHRRFGASIRAAGHQVERCALLAGLHTRRQRLTLGQLPPVRRASAPMMPHRVPSRRGYRVGGVVGKLPAPLR